MKKHILSVVIALSLLATLTVIGLANYTSRIRADIPFDFMVGTKQLPAGQYAIWSGTTSSTLTIRSEDAKHAAMFLVQGGQIAKGELQAKLDFHRYGNQYFLAQVWDGVSDTGQQLLKSKAEREAAKKRDYITQNTGEPEVVSVLASVGQ
jgi:hypothetical protein